MTGQTSYAVGWRVLGGGLSRFGDSREGSGWAPPRLCSSRYEYIQY